MTVVATHDDGFQPKDGPLPAACSGNDDIFASIASKYRVLFQLPQPASVLLIGSHAAELIADFERRACRVSHIDDERWIERVRAESAEYDLVWLESAGRRGLSDAEARALPRLLKKSGWLLITGLNPLSLRRLKGMARFSTPVPRGGYLSPRRFRRQFRRAGMAGAQTFLVQPYSDAPVDFLRADAAIADLPYNEGRAGRALARLGVYAKVHPRYAVTAGPDDELLSGLRAHLNARIGRALGAPMDLSIDRAILRARGALILSLLAQGRGERYICRLATEAAVDTIISRNTRVLAKLHCLRDLHRDHKDKLPRAVTASTYNGHRLYVETAKAGVLAWRITAATPSLGDTVSRDSLDFIHALHRASRRTIVLSPPRYRALIGNDLALLAGTFARSNRETQALEAIDRGMKAHFLGRSAFLVWAHGDFGPGNVLCDPSSGRLRGVIDWDTFRIAELPAIDWLNFLLQDRRTVHQGRLAPALRDLWRDARTDGALTAAVCERYGATFALTKSDLAVYCCLAAIRMAVRALPYACERERERGDYREVLCTIGDLLANCPPAAMPRR